jgi:hypothetical protein
MRERSYLWLLFVFAATGLIADQATKYGVFGWLAGVEGHCYAVFQTEPLQRVLEIVPAEDDPFLRGRHRGFFFEVASSHGSNQRASPSRQSWCVV